MNGERPSTVPSGATDKWFRVALVSLPPLILLLHQATLGAYLFEDDVSWILTGQTSGLGDVFAWRGRSVFYRPMVGLHFVVFAGWLRGEPWLLHLVNVALHALNVILVYRLARVLDLLPPAAFAAALVMAVASRSVESVAWISGVSSVLLTTFFLLSVIFDRRADRTGRRTDRLLSLTFFSGALLTHEAGVTLLPFLVLFGLWCDPRGSGLVDRVRRAASRYWPHAALLLGYLAIAISVNRRNFVVTEGHYRAGWHGVENLSQYLVAIYVGRPNMFWGVVTLALFASALLVRRVPTRFGAAWTLLTILPFCFFTWGLTWRYLYLPAVGFAVLLASLLPLDSARSRSAVRLVATVVAVFVAFRFVLFGVKAVRDASRRAEAYRTYVDRFRRQYPHVPRGATVTVPPPSEAEPKELYIEPLLRVALGDPSLRVTIAPPKVRTPDGAR